MVYFGRTYTSIVPFLKGLHLTIDSWRPNRTQEGWNRRYNKEDKEEELELSPGPMQTSENDEIDLHMDDSDILSEVHGTHNVSLSTTLGSVSEERAQPPDLVKAVPRLKDDLLVLQQFLNSPTPPWRFVRGKRIVSVRYGFGDAAKSGFGASFELSESKIWF